MTRSKKSRAHSFITTQVDKELSSEDSDEDNSSEITLGNCYDYAISAKPEYNECIYALINDEEIAEPSSTTEALQSPIWSKSMDEELKALHNKQTWEVVNPPKNANIVGCKWVYTCKSDSAGRFIHAKS